MSNPIEAGARAIFEADPVVHSPWALLGDKAKEECCVMARAAAIAMVGALEPRQCLDVLMEAGKGTTDSPFCHERFIAELTKQLTED